MRSLAFRWTLLLLAPTLAWAQTPTDADLFDDTVLHEVRFTMHPSDWARLRQDFADNTYYPTNVTWRGITVENAGIRSRGFGSRNGTKPGLRVDIDRFEDDQEFLGIKSFILKPNVQDPSQIHERLAMQFYPFLGLPAPREAYTRLFVNGEYAGLYAIVESPDKHFLNRVFGENDGYMYQYEWVAPYRFEYLGSDANRYVPSPFQPQTHEERPDADVLVALIRQMNEASDADFAAALAPYLDLKKFMTHLAVETFLAESDGILGVTGLPNFYLYRFDKKNPFQFIVWDKDRTFSDPEQNIFRNFNDNVLARRALALPEARRTFLETLLRCAVLAGAQQGWLDYQISRLYNQVQTAALQDDKKLCPDAQGVLQPCTNGQFEQGVTRAREFAAQRSDIVRRAVATAGFQLSSTGPRLSQGGVPLTPGSLFSLYGERLAGAEAQAAAVPLPTTLGGVSVFLNGFPVPLLFVSPGQINFQVPWEVSGDGIPVTVVLNDVVGNTVSLDVGQSPPVLYSITNADGTPVTGARAGDVVIIRATGLGPVNGNPVTGRVSPADPLLRTRELPTVQVGGVSAEVLFSGLTPGLIGVYQMNVLLPAGVPAGSQTPVVVGVGSQVSAPLPIPTI